MTLLPATAPRVFRCTLPMPPTANNLFPTSKTGHRFPSVAYKKWKADALLHWHNSFTVNVALKGRIAVKYRFWFTDKRRRDIANFEKATTDFLVGKGIIKDDCQIDQMELERGLVLASDARVEIELREIE